MLNFSKRKAIIFPYKECEITIGNQKEKVFRPLALVGIYKKNLTMNALIDTGSDRTISYLYPFGKSFGVNIDDFEGEPEEISGLFSGGTAFAKHMDVWMGDHYFNIPIHWLTQPFSIKNNYQMILGRKIIFDHFDIVFRQKEKKVYFYHKG